MAVRVPLLSSSIASHRRRCYSAYQFQFIHSKGAILVLLWDLLIGISFGLMISFLVFEDQFGIVVIVGISLVLVLAGFFGDFLFKKYNIVLIGIYISFVLLIAILMTMVLLSCSTCLCWLPLGVFVLISCHSILISSLDHQVMN